MELAVETRQEVSEPVVDEDGLPAALLEAIRALDLANVGTNPGCDRMKLLRVGGGTTSKPVSPKIGEDYTALLLHS